jgi:hypothetical protein
MNNKYICAVYNYGKVEIYAFPSRVARQTFLLKSKCLSYATAEVD